MRVVDKVKGKINERLRLAMGRQGIVLGEGTREERRAQAAVALGLGYRLPEGGLGRVLALWGFAGVPFFRAFREPTADGSITLERGDRGSSGTLPGEGRTR